MTEILASPSADLQRFDLHDHLAAIDHDPVKLQEFIGELYHGHPENPHVLYMAATHLTSLSYLDRRGINDRPLPPEPEAATRAFETYARLISMLVQEKTSPRYITDAGLRKRLSGAREELAMHAVLAYATAKGADFVALPSPGRIDFEGADEASDIQVFFPDPALDLEIQATLKPSRAYHPRIAVLNLATALRSVQRAVTVRGLLKDIGDRDGYPGIDLASNEHDILLDAAGALLLTVRDLSDTNIPKAA